MGIYSLPSLCFNSFLISSYIALTSKSVHTCTAFTFQGIQTQSPSSIHATQFRNEVDNNKQDKILKASAGIWSYGSDSNSGSGSGSISGRSSMTSVSTSMYKQTLAATLLSSSDVSALPNDNQFYDGYEEFIQNLQEDLESDSFDIYDNNNVIQEQPPPSTTSNGPATGRTTQDRRNNNNNSRNKIPRYKRDMNDDLSTKVNEETVKELIVERSKAQREREYNKADSILNELNSKHGVYVWDKDRLWSSSPIAPSRRYGGNSASGSNSNTNNKNRKNRDRYNKRRGDTGEPNNQFGRNGHDYVQIGEGIDKETCQLELHEIHSLLAKRLEYKLVRQFKKADEIQTQLYENGVRVHDKLKQWRADNGIFADIEGLLSGKGYMMNKHSDTIEDTAIVQKVEKMIDEWSNTRKRFDYEEADRLRQVLWDTHRVAVDDKSKTWSAGGDFGPDGTFRWTDDGPINPRRDSERAKKDWRKTGMYTLSSLSEPLDDSNSEEEIWNLIHDRLEARRVKDFDVADLIRDHLYKEYRISVDDQLRQWSVGGEFAEDETRSVRSESPTTADGKVTSSFVRVYNLRGGKSHLSDKEVSLVEALVKRRSEEMARYNQQAAESIRIGLKKKFYVVIDDVNSEWHIRGNDFILNPKIKSLPEAVVVARKEIEILIRERSQARGEGDFNRADEIRSDLLETFNITLDDRVKEWTVTDSKKIEDSITSTKEDEDSDEARLSLSSLTVAKLKEELKVAGLPVSGKKADLIERLLNHE